MKKILIIILILNNFAYADSPSKDAGSRAQSIPTAESSMIPAPPKKQNSNYNTRSRPQYTFDVDPETGKVRNLHMNEGDISALKNVSPSALKARNSLKRRMVGATIDLPVTASIIYGLIGAQALLKYSTKFEESPTAVVDFLESMKDPAVYASIFAFSAGLQLSQHAMKAPVSTPYFIDFLRNGFNRMVSFTEYTPKYKLNPKPTPLANPVPRLPSPKSASPDKTAKSSWSDLMQKVKSSMGFKPKPAQGAIFKRPLELPKPGLSAEAVSQLDGLLNKTDMPLSTNVYNSPKSKISWTQISPLINSQYFRRIMGLTLGISAGVFLSQFATALISDKDLGIITDLWFAKKTPQELEIFNSALERFETRWFSEKGAELLITSVFSTVVAILTVEAGASALRSATRAFQESRFALKNPIKLKIPFGAALRASRASWVTGGIVLFVVFEIANYVYEKTTKAIAQAEAQGQIHLAYSHTAQSFLDHDKMQKFLLTPGIDIRQANTIPMLKFTDFEQLNKSFSELQKAQENWRGLLTTKYQESLQSWSKYLAKFFADAESTYAYYSNFLKNKTNLPASQSDLNYNYFDLITAGYMNFEHLKHYTATDLALVYKAKSLGVNPEVIHYYLLNFEDRNKAYNYFEKVIAYIARLPRITSWADQFSIEPETLTREVAVNALNAGFDFQEIYKLPRSEVQDRIMSQTESSTRFAEFSFEPIIKLESRFNTKEWSLETQGLLSKNTGTFLLAQLLCGKNVEQGDSLIRHYAFLLPVFTGPRIADNSFSCGSFSKQKIWGIHKNQNFMMIAAQNTQTISQQSFAAWYNKNVIPQIETASEEFEVNRKKMLTNILKPLVETHETAQNSRFWSPQGTFRGKTWVGSFIPTSSKNLADPSWLKNEIPLGLEASIGQYSQTLIKMALVLTLQLQKLADIKTPNLEFAYTALMGLSLESSSHLKDLTSFIMVLQSINTPLEEAKQHYDNDLLVQEYIQSIQNLYATLFQIQSEKFTYSQELQSL